MAPMYGNLDFAFFLGGGAVRERGICDCSRSKFSFPFPLSFFWFPLCARGGGGGGGARQEALSSPCRATPTGFFLSFSPLRLSGFLLFSSFGFLFSFGFAPRRNGLHVSRSLARTEPGGPGGDPETGPASPPVCKGARARTGRIASGVSEEDLTDLPCLERAPSKDCKLVQLVEVSK